MLGQIQNPNTVNEITQRDEAIIITGSYINAKESKRRASDIFSSNAPSINPHQKITNRSRRTDIKPRRKQAGLDSHAEKF